MAISGCEGVKSGYILALLHQQQVNDHDFDDFQQF